MLYLENLKGALCSFGEDILTVSMIFCLCLIKLNKQTLHFHFQLNKQTDLKGQHSFTLFYFVFMWCVSFKQCSGDLIFL